MRLYPIPEKKGKNDKGKKDKDKKEERGDYKVDMKLHKESNVSVKQFGRGKEQLSESKWVRPNEKGKVTSSEFGKVSEHDSRWRPM